MKYSEIKFRSSISFSEELLSKVSKESSLSKEEINSLTLEIKKEYKEVLLPKVKEKITKELNETGEVEIEILTLYNGEELKTADEIMAELNRVFEGDFTK